MRYVPLFILIGCSGAEVSTETSQVSTPTVAEGNCELQNGNALRIDCNFSNLAGTNTTVVATDGVVARSFEVEDGLTTIWGLTEEMVYEVSVLDNTGASIYSKTITTGTIPNSVGLSASVTGTRDKGGVLVQDCASDATLVIFDDEGSIVWYQDFTDLVPGAELYGYTLTKDDSIVVSTGHDSIAEVALSGQLLRTISLSDYGLTGLLHHDIQSRNGMIYGLFAYQQGSFVYDGVYIFDEQNAHVGTIESHNFIDGQAVLDAGFIPPDQYWSGVFSNADSAGHGNSVFMSENGELVISYRFLNTVVSLDGDHTSGTFGDVNWMLEGIDHGAIEGDFSLVSDVTADLEFEAPHCAQIGPTGALTVFDNGVGGVDARGLTISLDGNRAEITGSYNLQEECAVQSSIIEMDNGDVLLGCAETFMVYEFSPGESSPHWTMAIQTTCSQGGGGPPPMTPRALPVALH